MLQGYVNRYKGLRLIASKSAIREIMRYGISVSDCKNILEEGFDAPRRRAEGTEEKWLREGTKTYNVVVVKDYNHFYEEAVYLITHIGRFGLWKK